MAKEILLYDSIDSYSAERFITAMEEARDSDISMRVSCNGGNPEEGWGMIAKWAEHPKAKSIKVDGKAYSMGTFFLCYTDEVSCLDVTEFLIHRAAYSKYYEQSDYMTDEVWANLDRINNSLRAALEAKIDVDKFEKLKKVTLDEVFSNDSRIDVYLSAKEAKAIGLVNKVVKITPEKRAEINSLAQLAAAHYQVEAPKAGPKPPKSNININSNSMNLEKFKAEHPEVYAQAVKAGVDQERDRVGAWMAYVDVDAKAVAEGIDAGNNISQKTMAELNRKQFSAESLKEIEASSQGDVTTDKVKEVKASGKDGKTEEVDTEVTAFYAQLGLEAPTKN